MLQKNILVMACLAAVLSGCQKEKTDNDVPEDPAPPPSGVFLKDIVYKNLPSPYYHLEYNDSGFIIRAAVESGLARYDISYTSKQISEMKNTVQVNKDKLVYQYADGKPFLVKYINGNGMMFRRCFISYNANGKLQKMEWEVLDGPGAFIIERTIDLNYYADGNLHTLTNQRHKINGKQEASVYTDSFENYDDQINVDGFTLLHLPDEHLLLLPDSGLQLNNPRRLVRTGDALALTYEIDYTYTYRTSKHPVTRIGAALFTSGPDAGKRFQTQTVYGYY